MRLLRDRPVESFDEYTDRGGGVGLAQARAVGPDAVIERVQRSGLRGRGGGGFPTGRKWRTVRDAVGTQKYVVVNGAEGEPGTFKDRALLRSDPYQVVEGAAIAALAVGARDLYIGLKARFTVEIARVQRAVEEMASAGMLDGLDVTIAEGPDEYLFGEEKALLEVIEGNEPLPRVLPPFQHGLFATDPQLGWSAHSPEPGEQEEDQRANPTLVNNVETLAHATWISAHGPDWFRELGTAQTPGTLLPTLAGDVTRAGVFEVPAGLSLRALVEEHGQGTASGRPVKMVCSGVANAVMTGEQLDAMLDFDALAAAGGGLGSAGFVLYADDVCAVAVARSYSRFLYVESCGQCPACKLGTGAITDALEQIEATGDGAALGLIERALTTVADGNRCYLPVEEQLLVSSILRRFPEDVVAHEEQRCELSHDVVVPKLVDLADEGFTYDIQQIFKQPDWTYAITTG